MITKEEFLKRIKDNTFFKDFKEHTEYRVAVVDYYLKNETSATIQSITPEGTTFIKASQCNIEITSDTSRTVINQMYDLIRKNKKYEVLQTS